MPRERTMPAQMPLSGGRSHTQCPYTRAKPKTPLVFDIPVRVSVLEPPIIPQNDPAGKLNAPICLQMPRYVRGYK